MEKGPEASSLSIKPVTRNSLMSLVQGLGIKLPVDCGQAKFAKVENSGLSLSAKQRHGSPTSPRRIRPSSPRHGSPRAIRTPRTKSPRSISPPMSPRATSPVRTMIPPPQRRLSPQVQRPIASPRFSLHSKADSAGITKRSAITQRASIQKAATTKALPKAKIIPKTVPKAVSTVSLMPKTPLTIKKRKDPVPDAPAPILTPQAQREIEASQAMVSPRIDFDSIIRPSTTSPQRAASPPPESAKKKFVQRQKGKEKRNLVLQSLVTKVESSSDPNDAGKSRAEIVYRKHLYQTFRGLKMARSLPPADPIQLQAKRVVLMKPPGKYRRKTAIFDLDETLVHCLDRTEPAVPDVVLPIRFPNGDIVHVSSTQANIKIRPYCTECLTQVSQDMELIVFTASQRSYADAVMNYIDPTRTLIHHRLYRDSCVVSERVHIKDLRVLANRSLKDVVLIDNAAYSFGYQLDNGIPIVSWHYDPDDKELLYLMDYLKTLMTVDDVREVNQTTFHLATFYDDYCEEFLGKMKGKGK